MVNRTLGTVPISVGTAMAIEALQSAPMHRYQTLLVNLRTVVRNAREAFEELPSETELFNAAKDDVVGIANYIAELKLKTLLDIKFYYPSYQALPRLFPLAKLKEQDPSKLVNPKEENRKKKIILDNNVLKRLIKEFDKFVSQVDSSIPQFSGDGLIITHHPVDLVTTESYHRLHLLESHTGSIKGYVQFYTKLTGGKELTNIPLNKLTIQIFGDNAVNFMSQSISVKNEIKALAKTVPWSTASTPSFIASTIRRMPSSAPERDILLKMIK